MWVDGCALRKSVAARFKPPVRAFLRLVLLRGLAMYTTTTITLPSPPCDMNRTSSCHVVYTYYTAEPSRASSKEPRWVACPLSRLLFTAITIIIILTSSLLLLLRLLLLLPTLIPHPHPQTDPQTRWFSLAAAEVVAAAAVAAVVSRQGPPGKKAERPHLPIRVFIPPLSNSLIPPSCTYPAI